MNIILKFRERVSVLSYALVQELEQLLGVIRQTFRAEHNDDGTHGAVTATSVTTGVFNGTEIRIGIIGDGLGYTRLVQGTTLRPGYIDWRLADGTRLGFLGWSSTDVELTLENGALFSVVGNAMQITEISDPAAGATNTARVYCRDNGAGKTQLCVRFATGAIQVLATEP